MDRLSSMDFTKRFIFREVSEGLTLDEGALTYIDKTYSKSVLWFRWIGYWWIHFNGHVLCCFSYKEVLLLGWGNHKRMFFCLGININKCSLTSSWADWYLEKNWQLIEIIMKDDRRWNLQPAWPWTIRASRCRKANLGRLLLPKPKNVMKIHSAHPLR